MLSKNVGATKWQWKAEDEVKFNLRDRIPYSKHRQTLSIGYSVSIVSNTRSVSSGNFSLLMCSPIYLYAPGFVCGNFLRSKCSQIVNFACY